MSSPSSLKASESTDSSLSSPYAVVIPEATESTDSSLSSLYAVLIPISQDSFGSVKFGYHRITGMPVTIKILEHTEEKLQWILSEMATLKTLNHPHIVRLFQTLVSSDYIYLIREYIPGGNLKNHILKAGRLKEEEAKKIFGQIVATIKYCHDFGIVHRDIKPQNILMDEHGNAKVTDFGLSTKFRAGTKLYRQCGTFSYIAPEVLLGEGYDGTKADIWSLGVLLYEMTTGHLPFVEITLTELWGKIITGDYRVPGHVSGQLENLIHQMLTVVPERRPTLEDIENHPWVIKCDKYSDDILKPENSPDPNILALLEELGYDPYKVCESLRTKSYDEYMGFYLILKEWLCHGFGPGYNIAKEPDAPGYQPATNLASDQHPPTCPRPSGEKEGRCVSRPFIDLHNDCIPPCEAKDLSCMNSCKLLQPPSLPPGSHSYVEMETPSNRSVWQRLKNGIPACVQSCCSCCLPARPTQRFNNKVSPTKAAS